MKIKKFIKNHWDILLVIPILYGFVSTAIATYLGVNTPSFWLGFLYNNFGSFGYYLIGSIGLISSISLLIRSYQTQKLRWLNGIAGLISIGWIIFILYRSMA